MNYTQQFPPIAAQYLCHVMFFQPIRDQEVNHQTKLWLEYQRRNRIHLRFGWKRQRCPWKYLFLIFFIKNSSLEVDINHFTIVDVKSQEWRNYSSETFGSRRIFFILLYYAWNYLHHYLDIEFLSFWILDKWVMLKSCNKWLMMSKNNDWLIVL